MKTDKLKSRFEKLRGSLSNEVDKLILDLFSELESDESDFTYTVQIFIIHSKRDSYSMHFLEKCLNLIKRKTPINIFHKEMIDPGSNVDKTLENKLFSSDIVIPLISINFFDEEEKCCKLFESAWKQEKRIIPILVRDCDWTNYKYLEKIQADILPQDNGKILPTSRWGENGKDDIFTIISKKIHKIVEDIAINLKYKFKDNEIKKFNIETCGLKELTSWGQAYPLKRDNILSRESNKKIEDTVLFTPDILKEYKSLVQNRKEKNFAGTNFYLSDISIDWREDEKNEKLGLGLSRCDYSEKLATQDLLAQNSLFREKVYAFIQEKGALEYIKNSLPAAVVCCVTILNRDMSKFFAVQRSQNVATDKGVWTFGIYETMSASKDGTDIHNLINRGIYEEINITEDRFIGPEITWIGIVIMNPEMKWDYMAGFHLTENQFMNICTTILMKKE